MSDVAIIGGGASGLFCAIYIKHLLNKLDINNTNITIYERLEKTGKKLLATGNGKCNFSNKHTSKEKYNNPEFVEPLLKKFNYKHLREFLEELGLYTVVDSEGRAYPQSETANSVLDILRTKIKIEGITESCNTDIKKITYLNGKYILETNRNQKMQADYLVMATGGKACPIHGSNGSGYVLLKPFKHKIVDPRPGLVSIKTDPNQVKSLAGIRVKANVLVYDKKKKSVVWQEAGEVLFKPDGLSGIVMMQASTFMQRNNGSYKIYLDLCPNYTEEAIVLDLTKRFEMFKGFEISQLLTGMFNKMLNLAILKKAKIDLSGHVSKLTKKDILKIAKVIKEFEFDYDGTFDFDKAQVTIGGVDLTEVNRLTLESKKSDNLYIIGELLDIDGECGGFNLQWAFTSGVIAALNIAEKIKSFEND